MISDFTLHRPATVAEALALSQHYRGAASFMAGGVSLINGLKTGLPIGHVIHLGRLPAFTTITAEAGRLHIGAGVTLWQLQTAPQIARLGPAVQHAITQIGNVRIRMKATIGGNIMARDPSYDITPLMIALGATMVFANEHGGVTQTAASEVSWPNTPPPGLLLSLSVPADGTWFGYDRSLRPALTLSLGIDNSQTQARIGIACAYPQAFGDTIALPRGLNAAAAAELAQDWVAKLPEPVTDAAASGRYRRRMAAVLLRRQLDAFLAPAA